MKITQHTKEKTRNIVREVHMFVLPIWQHSVPKLPSGLSSLILKGLPPVFNSTASTCISIQWHARSLGQVKKHGSINTGSDQNLKKFSPSHWEISGLQKGKATEKTTWQGERNRKKKTHTKKHNKTYFGENKIGKSLAMLHYLVI